MSDAMNILILINCYPNDVILGCNDYSHYVLMNEPQQSINQNS